MSLHHTRRLARPLLSLLCSTTIAGSMVVCMTTHLVNSGSSWLQGKSDRLHYRQGIANYLIIPDAGA